MNEVIPQIDEVEEKREIYNDRFKKELEMILQNSKNQENIAEGFNKIIHMLNMLIRISLKRGNNGKKIQSDFFEDISNFINNLYTNVNLTKIYNSIAKTSFSKYNTESIGEELSQLLGKKERNEEQMPEGGSCSYRTLLLYHFFNKLKQSGLDIKIKIFRFKNFKDRIADGKTLRHSGLIVTYEGEDYSVDADGPIKGQLIKKIQPYIAVFESINDIETLDIFENLKHENMKETDKMTFFDNPEDYISHIKKNPNSKKMIFYLQLGTPHKGIEKKHKQHGNKSKEKQNLAHITFEYGDRSIYIKINNKKYRFFLEDNNISITGFPLSIIEKLTIEKDEQCVRKTTKESQKLLKRILPYVFNRINIDYYDFIPMGERRYHRIVNGNVKRYTGIPNDGGIGTYYN